MNKRRNATIVVAASQNGTIGKNNSLPWHLRSDLQRFKKLTMGHALIMGRKTFESIGRVLPGRTTIVLARTQNFSFPGVIVVGSLNEAFANLPAEAHPFIIGGGQVFREAMPIVNRIYFTRVLADIDGDATFEEWDRTDWNLIHHEDVPASETDQYATQFEIWEHC